MKKSRAIDPDVLAVKRCVREIEKLSPKSQQLTIAYLLDRFIAHPKERPKMENKPA